MFTLTINIPSQFDLRLASKTCHLDQTFYYINAKHIIHNINKYNTLIMIFFKLINIQKPVILPNITNNNLSLIRNYLNQILDNLIKVKTFNFLQLDSYLNKLKEQKPVYYTNILFTV